MRVGRCSAEGDVSEGGHAEVNGRSASGDEDVELDEFGVRCGQADLEPFGLAAPAFAFGLGDAGDQIVADIDEAGPLAARITTPCRCG
ncbi:hypothetical protein [Streptomyces avermitilis]|uniref:hypothetical protein n=1 Tax=Streptomyces avermitilis TaxID=33903 RepID=UPI00367BE6AF